MSKTTSSGSGEKASVSSKVNVNVSIDKGELAEIKAVTHIDSSATALLAAARQGVEYLRSHLGHLNSATTEEK